MGFKLLFKKDALIELAIMNMCTDHYDNTVRIEFGQKLFHQSIFKSDTNWKAKVFEWFYYINSNVNPAFDRKRFMNASGITIAFNIYFIHYQTLKMTELTWTVTSMQLRKYQKYTPIDFVITGMRRSFVRTRTSSSDRCWFNHLQII